MSFCHLFRVCGYLPANSSDGLRFAAGHCPVSFDLCRPCLVERDASTLARHNPSHVFLGLKEPVDLDLLKQVTRFSSRRPRGLIEWDLYS